MRKSEGDITSLSLYHCFIHSHTKTYPDKAVEKEQAAWPSREQGPDKAVIKGPTTCTSKTGRPGQRTRAGHRVCNRGTRTAGGDQDDTHTGFASAANSTTPEHKIRPETVARFSPRSKGHRY